MNLIGTLIMGLIGIIFVLILVILLVLLVVGTIGALLHGLAPDAVERFLARVEKRIDIMLNGEG